MPKTYRISVANITYMINQNGEQFIIRRRVQPAKAMYYYRWVKAGTPEFHRVRHACLMQHPAVVS